MKHKTFSWTSGDKKTIFAQCWMPDQETKKSILFVHGLGEHSGRYDKWAKRFTENGYNFLALDLRGHGKSAGKRGHARSLSVLLDDIDLMFAHAEEIFPGHRLILYGHSMGGSLVLNHVIRRNHPLSALIVTSPWLRLTREPPWGTVVLASLMNKIYPSFTVKSTIKPDQLSHDPEFSSRYTTDPLVHNKISVRLFFELHEAGKFALRNVYKINYPFLLMHGTADTITSPRASENYVMNTSKKTRLKLWEGQYHELHNELVADEVFRYIIDWLRENNL